MKRKNVVKHYYLEGPQGSYLIDAISADKYKIRVTSVSIHFTYRHSSIITGSPNEQMNKETIEEIKQYIKNNNCYDLPIFLANIEESKSLSQLDDSIAYLPFMFYVAELESDGVSEDYIFSSMLYVSFHQNIELAQMEEIISKDLMLLYWGKIAKDWNP